MKASQFSEAQKAFILKQGRDGMPVAEICRKAGISQATYFNWKKKYDGLLPTEMRRLLSRSWSHISYGSALRYLNVTIGAAERMVRTIVETQLRLAVAPVTGKAGLVQGPIPSSFPGLQLGLSG